MRQDPKIFLFFRIIVKSFEREGHNCDFPFQRRQHSSQQHSVTKPAGLRFQYKEIASAIHKNKIQRNEKLNSSNQEAFLSISRLTALFTLLVLQDRIHDERNFRYST